MKKLQSKHNNDISMLLMTTLFIDYYLGYEWA